MVKKIIIVTFFCLSSLFQAEFQQSWQQDMKDLAKHLLTETIQDILKNPYLDRASSEATIETCIQIYIKEFARLRAEELLEKDIKNDYLLLIIKHMKKTYNFSDDLFFKKGAKDNNFGFYKRRYRIINLNEKKFLERKSSLGLLTFILLHEIGHLRQHEKLGLLQFEEKSTLENKYLEEDADKFAMSYFCKKCRQELKEEIINMHYSWVAIKQDFVDKNLRNAYIALGFQSEQDCKEKISQIAKKGLRRVALKLCNKSNKKFEKLFEDMKNKKIISEARHSKDYLSKEEFLKELDLVETKECLCCKFIGQEKVHTAPTEL